MKTWLLPLAAWLALGPGTSLAQKAAIPPPTPPLVHRAPAFASWTVTFKYKEEAKPAAGAKPTPVEDRIQTIAVTKTDLTYWEQTVWKSGRSEEKWILDGLELKAVPGSQVVMPISPPTADSPNPEYSDYRQTDFEGCDWVSLTTYKGTGLYREAPIYLFESPSTSAVKATVALSVENQWPLYASDGDITRQYTYRPAPTAPLTPPARFLEVLKKKQALKR